MLPREGRLEQERYKRWTPKLDLVLDPTQENNQVIW